MKTQKASFQLALNLGAAYTMYVIGKISFDAAKTGMIEAGVLTKAESGSIGGAFWLVYAIGQLIGTFIANKISPYALIEIALVGSTVSNLLMVCTDNYMVMMIIWCLGGVSQFGLWAAILKLTVENLEDKHRMILTTYLAYAYKIATVISNSLSAWVLSVLSWQYIFIISGMICGVALPGIVVVRKRAVLLSKKAEHSATVEPQSRGSLTHEIVRSRGLVFFAALMCIQSVVANGIGGWTSTILLELYKVPASTSSLLGVVQTGVAFAGIALGVFVYEKTRTDELRSLIICFAPLTIVMLLLNNISNYNVYVATILLYLSSIFLCSAGARLSLNYPARYRDIGLTATVGTIINCMTTGGMAISTYGGGYIAEHYGWLSVIRIWTILVILFIVIAISIIPLWERFKKTWKWKRN